MLRSLPKKFLSVFSLMAVPSLAAAAPVAAQQAIINAPLTAAPVPKTGLLPPPGHCGLFETCSGTKIGLGKGDFLIRLSALGVITHDMNSYVRAPGPGGWQKGRVSTTNQVMPELTFEYFFTDHISLDLIAASTRHEAKAVGTAAGTLDLGSTWVLPPTLTLAWHFRPHKRFNPYIGAGLTLAFFHNTSPAGGAIQKMDLRTTVGPTANIGFDYQLVGNWFFNFDAKQMFLNVPVFLNDRSGSPGPFLHARDSINPTTVAAGIEYRF